MDSPTKPLSKLSRDITTKRAEKNTTKLPKDSRRMANHLECKEDTYKRESPIQPASEDQRPAGTPVGDDPGVDALVVLIDGAPVVPEEALLVPIGPDNRQARHRLSEMRIDGRARHGV